MSYELDSATYKGRPWLIARGDGDLLEPLASVSAARIKNGVAAVPPSRSAFLLLEMLASPSAVSDDYKATRAAVLAPSAEAQCLSQSILAASGEAALAERLLPHQREWLAFSQRSNFLFNASEQGTGKTLMALASASVWDSRKVLVICPKDVAGEWASAVASLERQWHFTNLADGSVTERKLMFDHERARGYFWHVVAVNYDVLKKLRADFARWQPDLLVCDESWKIKGPSSARTRGVHWLVSAARPGGGPARRLLLAGTPVGKHAGELWAQLRVLNAASETYGAFERRFTNIEVVRTQNGQMPRPSGMKELPALAQRLSPVWFRATKEGCLRLPPKSRRRVEIALTRQQRALYVAVSQMGEAALGKELALTPPAVKSLRLQQVAGGHEPHPAEGRGWQSCTPLPCAKLDWLREWAEATLGPHPSVRAIVFCRFNAEVHRIWQALNHLGLNAFGVTGAGGPFPVDNSELDAAKHNFNSRRGDTIRVIVAQVVKLCAGHNLQAADHVVYFSNDWSHLVRSQSEDRAHRMGRTEGVTYWDLVATGTVDEDVLTSLEAKRDFAGRLCVETSDGQESINY